MVESYVDNCILGNADADKTSNEILRLARDRETFGVIFATGASQFETLRHLRKRVDLPWHKIIGFHLDEYVGLTPEHGASFRGYLREALPLSKMKAFYELDGTSSNPDKTAEQYAARLREVNPSLCLLGIGENGHLTFNDPWEADFNDPKDVRLVNLDDQCREQQYAEGWFDSIADVPLRALTLTVPAIMRVPMLIAGVPGKRKAAIVKKVFDAPITPGCPATILGTHPNATLYLDTESSTGITSLLHE
ncbi:6-phosphogluconolactonase [Edaphobacter albus]|uniref:6-phosphogluconolactonase n=1 Tax=Edaphobacter sp. 4G125 TaxID=2763071 RepID=UPI0021056777|nr:6-phosphogluconolactonase [Edaphobacter sp. 4G125]